jgi:hypothetical protein
MDRRTAFDHEWAEFGEITPGELVDRLAQGQCRQINLSIALKRL